MANAVSLFSFFILVESSGTWRSVSINNKIIIIQSYRYIRERRPVINCRCPLRGLPASRCLIHASVVCSHAQAANMRADPSRFDGAAEIASQGKKRGRWHCRWGRLSSLRPYYRCLRWQQEQQQQQQTIYCPVQALLLFWPFSWGLFSAFPFAPCLHLSTCQVAHKPCCLLSIWRQSLEWLAQLQQNFSAACQNI